MDDSVYIGVWTNWSYGNVHGLTLTVGQGWSDVIVAAITLGITFTGTQAWGILCFVAFRLRQTALGDHIYHQIQAALRNSASQILLAWRLIQIVASQRSREVWQTSAAPAEAHLMYGYEQEHWQGYGHDNYSLAAGRPIKQRVQGRSGRTFVRVSPLLFLALAFTGGFMATSLLGARFFKAADDAVLIESRHCGWPVEVGALNDAMETDKKAATALLMVPSRARINFCRAYARSCYAQADDAAIVGSGSTCAALVKPFLPSTMTTNLSCPYPGGASVCKSEGVRMDTGMMDSRDMLGINSADQDRIAVRKVMTCAAVDTTPWETEWFNGGLFSQYGIAPGDSVKGYSLGNRTRSTFLEQYPFWTSRYSHTYSTASIDLAQQVYMAGNESDSSFNPRAELRLENADLTLIAIRPSVRFEERVPDPWFNITKQHSNSPGWWSNSPELSILGCYEQYQFCVGTDCSPFDSLHRIRHSGYGLNNATPRQKAIADVVWKSLWAGQLQYSLLFMLDEILVFNELVMAEEFPRAITMPANQWMTEAWNFFNISLAILQRRPADYASPAAVLQEDAANRLTQPESSDARKLCNEIKIRSSKYTCFKVLSLAILPFVAVIVWLLNILLPHIFSETRWRRDAKNNKQTSDWEGYDYSQLIRLICQARGIGVWDRQEKTVPAVRNEDEKFPLVS